MKHWYDVAIVGGGASGTFFAAQLLRGAPDSSICWIAPEEVGGPAYSTQFDSHLLNVPAARMGAFVDQPQHFHDWLTEHAEFGAFSPTDYVPRRLYGEYLRALRTTVSRSSRIDVSAVRAALIETVVDGAETGWRLDLQDGSTIWSRRLILAAGLPVDRQVRGEVDPTVVREPWEWLRTLPEHWSVPTADRVVKIIGSGLTAMDVIVALRDLGFAGQIRVQSRSAKWSTTHESTAPLSEASRETLIGEMLEGPTCRHYVRTIRRHTESQPWRAVIDGLRPSSQRLWEALPLVERERFLRHLFGIWNRHRHRAPPATARRIAADMRLSVSRGRTLERAPDEALVIDCRGMGLTTTRIWPRFVTQLLDVGALVPSALGIGLQSNFPQSLEVLGAMRFGQEFECTAVPELRQQACMIIDRWALG